MFHSPKRKNNYDENKNEVENNNNDDKLNDITNSDKKEKIEDETINEKLEFQNQIYNLKLVIILKIILYFSNYSLKMSNQYKHFFIIKIHIPIRN